MDITSPDIEFKASKNETQPHPNLLERTAQLTRTLISKLPFRSNQSQPLIQEEPPVSAPTQPVIEEVTLPSETLDPVEVKETRNDRRNRKKAEYEAGRQAQITVSEKEPQKKAATVQDVAIKDAEQAISKELEITVDDMPWIDKTEKVQLKPMKLKGTGIEVYFADFIRSKNSELEKARNKAERSGRMKYLDELLPLRLVPVIQDKRMPPDIPKPRANRPIYKISGSDKARVFYMDYGKLDGNQVIVRIAVCTDVTTEYNNVYPTISYLTKGVA